MTGLWGAIGVKGLLFFLLDHYERKDITITNNFFFSLKYLKEYLLIITKGAKVVLNNKLRNGINMVLKSNWSTQVSTRPLIMTITMSNHGTTCKLKESFELGNRNVSKVLGRHLCRHEVHITTYGLITTSF